MHIKFDVSNEGLVWYKKCPKFAKWTIQNNSVALAETHMQRKNEKTQP